MCYSDDARPPLPPIGGAAADHGDLVLTSADGTRFSAYFARASKPTGAGMVILPDVRGLHTFYKELARRFAEAGVDAVAFDYFGRTTELGSPRDESFEWKEHIAQTTPANVDADARAAMDYLRSPDGGGVRSVFTVGFCFGGDSSWRQAANGSAGSAGFYGVPARLKNALPDLTRLKAPLLLLVAGADFTPLEEFHNFDRELSAAGVPHHMEVYADAPHSFFDRTFDTWQDASADAWRKVLTFIEQHQN